MKRIADVQLTKNDGDDDNDIEDIELSQGFMKANETVLAARPIRGLPKRTGGSGAATFAPTGGKPETNGPTANFKGFSSSAPSSSPFTFSVGAPASNALTTQAATTTSNASFKFSGLPAVSSTASPATKEFASFIHSGTYTNGKQPSVSTANNKMVIDTGDVDYFSSLLGLNECFQAAMQKLLTESGFADLSVLFSHYTNFRTSIQKEYDAKQKNSSAPSVNGVASSSSAAPAASAPKLPVPPASFSGFGGSAFPPVNSSTAPTTTGGFKPSFGTTGAPIFGNSTLSSNVPSNPFSSGPSIASTSTPKPFTFGGSDSTSSSSSKAFVFGGSDKNTGETVPGSKVTFGAAEPTPKASLFGSSSNSSNTADKPALSVFSAEQSVFGGSGSDATTSTSSTATSGGLFGKIPSPFGSSGVGFSLSPTRGNVFGKVTSGETGESDKPRDASADETGSGVTDSRADTPVSAAGGEGDSPAPKVLGENPNDQEGEGEENEEIAYSCRASVYKFGEKDGAKQWVGRGVGIIRLKRHKIDGSRRLLSRNSATGKIMVNFKIYKGLTTKRDKNSLSLMGHEDGKEANFRIKVKDEATLMALQEAIDKAVSEL